MRSSALRAIAVATLVGGLAACAAETTAPAAPMAPGTAAQSSLLGGLVGTVVAVTKPVTDLLVSTVTILLKPVTLPTVRRDVALSRTVVATAVIGSAGGAFIVPGTGLTVTVAPGAVSVPTTFSATAYAGSAIAYDFAPHQKFAAPVVLTQTFAGTNAASLLKNGQKIEGGYFARTSDVDFIKGFGTTSEILTPRIDGSGTSISIGVLHFSGYMIATGRQGAE